MRNAGTLPDGITGIFHLLNPFTPTVALESTQPLNRNEYQGSSLAGKGCRYAGLTCADCLEILEVQPPESLPACSGMDRDSFTFFFLNLKKIE